MTPEELADRIRAEAARYFATNLDAQAYEHEGKGIRVRATRSPNSAGGIRVLIWKAGADTRTNPDYDSDQP